MSDLTPVQIGDTFRESVRLLKALRDDAAVALVHLQHHGAPATAAHAVKTAEWTAREARQLLEQLSAVWPDEYHKEEC